MKDQKSATPDPRTSRRCWPPRVRSDKLKATQWAFEGKWDGYRLLVEADHGRLQLRSRRGRDVTAEYPQLQALAADLADHHVVLDGEVVALDDSGVPSFGEMQNRARSTRVEFWAFDILWLDGRSLAARQVHRPAKAVGGLGRRRRSSSCPSRCPVTARRPWTTPVSSRFEGVVAKKRTPPISLAGARPPGSRTRSGTPRRR